MSNGLIKSLKDLVVRVEFDDPSEMPRQRELVRVDNEQNTPLLVQSLHGGNIAHCLNIYAERNLQKGMEVVVTGKSIELAVGDEMIGRIINAIGDPIDGVNRSAISLNDGTFLSYLPDRIISELLKLKF